MTTATTGTGTITLGSAASSGGVNFLTFAQAGVADGDVVTYAIADYGTGGTEIGRGTYTASGTTLTRTVLKSTNSNTAINLSGNAQVFITPAAEDLPVIAVGKTFNISNSLILAGTDGTTMTFPSASSTVVTLGNTGTFTKGFTFTPNLIGTVTSGTTTLDTTNGNYQMLINGGAFTLAPPAAGTPFSAIDLLVINGPSAGAITLSGTKWRVGSSTGSSFSTSVRASATNTMTIASPCVVTWTAHGCADGDPIYFTTTGALPTGVSANTVYYIKYIDANSFNLAATPGGSSINTSGSQSGTHTGNACSQFVFSVREIYGSPTYSWYALQ